MYLRALKRRAGDALVRGVGLALLAGLAAALFVRNNTLANGSAAVLATCVIAIVLLPGWVGALLPLVEAQRASAWLASSLGISSAMRVGVLATVVIGVYVFGTLLALGAAALGFATLFPDSAAATIQSLAWLAAVSVTTAIGMGLVTTRALVVADRELAVADRSLAAPVRDIAGAPVRVVSGSVVASALTIVALGWLGVAGAPLVVVGGAFALLTTRAA